MNQLPSEIASSGPATVILPPQQTLPVVFASPHSGRQYPRDLIESARIGSFELRASEDAFVDQLFTAAPKLGAPLLCATFPRAYVDVNRAALELDPRMFVGDLPGDAEVNSMRALSGLGSIPRVVSGGVEIYKTRLPVEEAFERIDTYYRPYHSALQKLIDQTRAEFGYCILIDCHSMPGDSCDSAKNRVDLVLGSSIAAAISAGDKKKYKDLCGIRGFPEVLPDVLELHGINWAKEDAQTFSKVASCLSSQELGSSTSSHIWSQMAEFLGYLRSTDISEIRTEDYSGLFDTLRHQSREQDIVAVARSLFHWLNRSVPNAGDGGDKLTVFQGEVWGEFAIAVWQIVSNSATEVVAADLIKSARVPAGANFSLGVLGKIRACKGFPHNSVELSTDTTEVLTVLPEIVEQELSCFCSVVVNGSGLLNQKNARKCLDKIATVLNDRIDQAEVGKLLDVVPHLRSYLEATAFKDSMAVALDSGALAHQWSSSDKKLNAKMSGLLKWVAVEARGAGIKLSTDIPTHPKFGDISSSITSFNKSFDETDIEQEELESVCGAVELARGFTRWQGYALTEREWFVEVFRELVSRARYLSVSVSDYIEKYEKTRKLVGDELAKQYLEHFAAWKNLFGENFSGKNSLKVAPAAIVDIHKFQISELSSLGDNIDKHLASLDAEEWFDKLSSGGQELDALCARLEVGGKLPPTGAFRPALFEYCKQILSGERTGVKDTKVSYCALSLSSASRKKIAKDLLVFMKDHNITTENAAGIVLEFPSISDDISFEHDPEAALDMFVLPLMSSPDEAVYQFLKRRVSDVKTACQLASSEVLERVKETMDGIGSKAEEDLSALEIFYKERLKL